MARRENLLRFGAQPVGHRRLIQFQEKSEIGILRRSIHNGSGRDVKHTGDLVVPSRREEVSPRLFRLQVVVLLHQIREIGRVARQPLKIDPPKGLLVVKVISDGACQIGRRGSSHQGNAEPIQLDIG